MADVVVGAELKVDTGNVAPSVKEVRDSIKQYKQELDNAKVGSEQHTEVLKKLKAANEQLNPSIKEQGSTFSQLKDHISATVPAFKGASEGASGFGSMLKGLMANPIVLLIAAIVAGLKFLYEAFKNTFEGGQKLEQIFSGIGAVITVLKDSIASFGRALLKAMTFDFSGAIKEIKGVANAAADAYNKVADLKKQEQKLNLELSRDALEDVQRQAQIAKLKESINDESIPFAKKKALGAELKKLSEENAKSDMDLAKRVADNKIAQLSVTANEAKKNEIEINKIREEQARNEIENTNEVRQVNKQVRALDKQEEQERKQAATEARAKEKEAKQKAHEEDKARRENAKAYAEKLLKLQHENELLEIQDANKKKLRELDFQLQDAKVAVDNDFENKKITALQRNALFQQLEKEHNLKIKEIQAAAAKEAEAKKKEQDIAAKKAEDDHLKFLRDIKKKELDQEIAQSKNNLLNQKFLLDQKQALIEQQYREDIAAAKDNADKKREIELQHNSDTFALGEARKAISKSEAESRANDVAAIGNALGALSDLIGKQTVVGKGLAIASSVINTYQGATKALAQGGIAGIASAVAVIASGLASVRNIIKTQVPGQASGGSAPSIAPPAPLQPTASVSTTALNQSTINGIGNAASGRAYVLEADVRNNSERVTRLNRAARLG